MFLKDLVVVSNGNIIRKIEFKSGLNLILDETNSILKGSGNNVGKSTLLKVLDYCFAGKIERIYTDNETKTENTEVKEFLQKSSTEIILTFGNKKNTYKIFRRCGCNPVLNDQELSLSDFKIEIGKALFKLNGTKPSLRQVLNKFLRIESYQVDQIYRFLFPASTKSDYENLYLYLLGISNFDLLDKKNTLIKRKKSLKSQKSALKGFKKGALTQTIKALDRDIESLKKSKSKFEVTESVKKEIDEMNNIRSQVSDISIEISEVNTRISMSKKTLSNLEKSKLSIDASMVKEVYSVAKGLVDHLNKDFDDVLNFHNQMLEKKIEFVKNSMDSLEPEKNDLELKMERLTEKEKILYQKLSEKGTFEDLEKIISQLNDLVEERGKRKGILEELENIDEEQKKVDRDIQRVNDQILKYQGKLDHSVDIFNKFYTAYSKVFYGEEYVLAYEVEDRDHFDFSVNAVMGAVGSGKKKGQISAFDLAYLSYLEKKDAQTCRFQLNDRMEEISINQLKLIFETANKIDGQFVVPILKDKVSSLGDEFLQKNTILQLSESNKFFNLLRSKN